MIKEELKYFLKTGQFKHIQFGISRIELIELLGDTDWIFFSSSKDTLPSIYKYGRIEFYFEDKDKSAGLSGIMYQPFPAASYSGKLQCNYHRWTKNMTIGKAISFLELNNIKYKEVVYSDLESRELLTEGQVHIFFDCYDKAGHFILHKAGKFTEMY